MKKNSIALPCIAAIAIATFVGTKSLQTNADESNNLLMANVEAMSAAEPGDTYVPIKCYYDKKSGYGAVGYICPAGTTSGGFKDCPESMDDVKPYTKSSSCIKIKHD